MSSNIKSIPSDKKFKGAPPADQNFSVTLDQQYLEMIEGDRSVPLNLAERFNDERQNLSLYRIYGKLQPYVDNAYSGQAQQLASALIYNLYSLGAIDYSDPTNIQYLGYPEFKEFDFIRKDVDDAVADETNWNLYISVPSTCNSTQQFTYQPFINSTPLIFVAGDGIPFYIKNITVKGKKLIEFNCGAPHGLKVGEYVKLTIRNYPFNNNQNTYPVYSVGNQKRKSNDTVFTVFIPSINLMGPTIPEEELGVFKRQLILSESSSISSYYIIEHEIITNVKDYNINKCAFAEGVFKEVSKFQPAAENPDGKDRDSVKVAYPTYVYTFVEDIHSERYLDNLQRPLTSLYVTIMLRNNVGYFNYPPNYGWDWNFPYDFIDSSVQTINYTVRGHAGDPQPISGIILPNPPNANINSGKALQPGDRLRGAFTEYNKYELKERTISTIHHSFTFNTNVFTTVNDGYVYTPHYEVPLRVYSDYIENGDISKVANVPNYATYFENEKIWKWRDIYDIGFIEGNTGVDYPFLNTAHYPKRDIDFFIHRGNRSTAFNNTISVSGASLTLQNFNTDGCE